jgi:tetratricopeptide (TPR) repeat protein
MLSEIILGRWQEASAIGERTRAISAQEVKAALDFFQDLRGRAADEVRSKLSTAGERLNRNLAWLLLAEALKIDFRSEIGEARRLIEWAEFIASFGGSLQNRGDNLEAHCKFYQGTLQQRVGSLSEAALLYAQAESDYRDNGSPILQALAISAQGTVALERGDLESDVLSRLGARELFQSALDVLDETTEQKLKGILKGAIEGSLRQWQFAEELVRSDQPEALLKDNREMIDLQLLSLLKAQTINSARANQPVATTAQAARLADLIAAQLQQPADLTDQLLGFYLLKKNTEAAEWLLRELLKTRPDDLELQKGLARTLMLHGKNQESLELLKELAQAHPDDALVQSMLGALLQMQGDLANAEARFRRALEIDPEEAGAKEGLRSIEGAKPSAVLRFEDGNLTIEGDMSDLAPGDLSAAMTAAILAADPSSIEARLNEIAQSDPELAQRVVELLQRQGVLGQASEPPAVQHYHLAEQFFVTGRWQEAAGEYSLAIEADPDFAEAYMGLGDVYYRTGRYHLAIAYFEESIAIKPAPFTYRFLGDSFLRAGKRKQAEGSYRQALGLDPNYAGARAALQQLSETEE